MKQVGPFLVATVFGVLAVAGCGSHGQAKPAAAPPQASPQVMAQQAAVRAQQAEGGLAVTQQHLHQSGPPSGANSTP